MHYVHEQGEDVVRKSLGVAAVVMAGIASLLFASAPAAQGVHPVQDRVVSDDPANFTPNVLDGSVKSIQQVGNLVVIGGLFTQIQAFNGGPVLARRNLAAFDATTGAISTTFAPDPDNEVTTVIPAGDGSSVFVGGNFDTISGATAPSLARVNVTTGARLTSFVTPAMSGRVKDLRLVGAGCGSPAPSPTSAGSRPARARRPSTRPPAR